MNGTIACKLLRGALMTLVVALGNPAIADTIDSGSISPRCTAAEFRQFDFWIGDWNTFEFDDLAGPSIARARVAPIAQGCAIHELYEQGDGLIGDSILSYDSVRRQWQQTWVTNRGSLMVLWGNLEGDALVLEGDAHLQDGSTIKQRITWKAQSDGVRESAVMSKDGGETWAPAFDVMFTRRNAESD